MEYAYKLDQPICCIRETQAGTNPKICEIRPENVISCQTSANEAQQEKRPSENPLGMSRKKFSNGGGQEKCNGTKFAAKFGCYAAAAVVAKHGRAGAGGRKVLTKRKSK